MSDKKQDLKCAHELGSTEKPGEASGTDPLADTSGLISQEVPAGVDRRHFLIRSAVGGAAAVMMGRTVSAEERTAMAVATMPPQAHGGIGAAALSGPECREEGKGPGADDPGRVLQSGPGPVEFAHDRPDAHHLRFLPALHEAAGGQTRQGNGAQGEPVRQPQRHGQRSRHGARRARGIGREGAGDRRPGFLDSLRDKPDQSFPVKLGAKTIDVTLKDVVFDATEGNFPHPNTMTVKLMAGNNVLLEQEYYSVGGGFIEWKGYTPPKKNPPKYPFATMKELRQHAEQNNRRSPRSSWPTRCRSSGRTEEEVYAFIDKITGAMVAIVKSGLRCPKTTCCRDRSSCKQGSHRLQARHGRQVRGGPRNRRSVGIRAGGIRRKRARPPGGHRADRRFRRSPAGPCLRAGRRGRKLDPQKIREGMLAAAAIGYLCKHNATLSAAEGGCQAEIGVASAMAAALIAAAYDASPSRRERGGIGTGASSGHDLRPGRRLRAGPVHRTLRIRRREGLDRLGHRQQRDRIQAPHRSGRDHHGDGPNRKGHE